MPSPSSHQQVRINLSDLKLQIAKQLGPERTKMYFRCLNKLLAQQLTKAEFSKFCFLVLGRENIPLHNKLIRSILKNVYQGKTPRKLVEKNVLSQNGAFVKKSLQGNDPLSMFQTATPPSLIHCNGDILPTSPRKRTCIGERKSPLGSNGRVEEYAHAQQSFVPSNKSAIKENDILGPCDWKRPVQQHQSEPAEQPAKVPHTENSLLHVKIPLHGNSLVEVSAREDEEKLEERSDLNSTRRHLRAPLGVPFCPSSVGGVRRSLPSASSSICGSSNYDTGELCYTEGLRKCMEKVAETQGIGVTLDCANLLNNALDAYLKRLIKSTFELGRDRSMHEPTNHPVFKQQVTEKPFNGIWPGNHMHVQNSADSLNVNNGKKNHYMISLRDFQVAMELNPQQLGENWTLLFEKICIRSHEQ